jgi:hypothetical protein
MRIETRTQATMMSVDISSIFLSSADGIKVNRLLPTDCFQIHKPVKTQTGIMKKIQGAIARYVRKSTNANPTNPQIKATPSGDDIVFTMRAVMPNDES